MRKTIAALSATGALLLGGAGVANATIQDPAPVSTTIVADRDANASNDNSDKTGLWGLAGLLGLLGLTGLKRRNDVGTTTTPAAAPRGPAV